MAADAQEPVLKPVGKCWFGRRWTERYTVARGCDRWMNRICARCGALRTEPLVGQHEWAPWETYEFKRPRKLGEQVEAEEIVVTHQRRRCRVCGFLDDEFIRYGSMGPPLPPLDVPQEAGGT